METTAVTGLLIAAWYWRSDPIVETAIGTAAFFGGVVAIIVLIPFLIGGMMPRIT